jgi:hypothetical protein
MAFDFRCVMGRVFPAHDLFKRLLRADYISLPPPAKINVRFLNHRHIVLKSYK